MANDEVTNGCHGLNGVKVSNGTKSSASEVDKIRRNSLYMTFNAPQVDDYHRGLFLTHPPLHTPTESDTSFNFSGTLFHAAYAASTWNLDQRAVRDVSTSHSLVLLYRLGTLDPSLAPIADQFSRIREILASVPLGKEARERELGPKKGNEVLGGYDCIIWTTDAVAALAREGVVDFGGRSVDEVIAEARSLAGPADAKSMVGVDFGGLKVVN
ncbi:hypothetical protein N431DRAFT_472237 [Stipitochalara longipes BDJ]|nr:hypothetical protein N431DRAFT_472237 [Stipitochalara longipes BDJ]